MILLDTDHVNVLKYPDHPRFASLTTQLNSSVDQDVATTVITVEEQMRGWLAWINRSDDVRRQVPAYQELLRLFDFFARWHVVLFDEQAASEFQGLRAQPRTSLGACLSVSPGQEVQRRLVRFSDEDECRPLHNGRAGANEGDLDIFDLAFPRTS